MTMTEARKMAAAIAEAVAGMKGSAHIGTWLDVPGISMEIHLDKGRTGLRYVVHNVIGESGCTVRLIRGDGRPGRGSFDSRLIGTSEFDTGAIAGVINHFQGIGPDRAI
jgi:hypothetical protein